MTVLSALVRAYTRLENPPPFGFSAENIGIVVGLGADGSVETVRDIRLTNAKGKRQSVSMLVPQPEKRTVAIAPNFLWDKTAYSLGLTAGGGKRTAEENEAFKVFHAKALSDTDDEGLRAFLRFLEGWTPDQFVEPLWKEEMKDQNVVFALESERRHRYLHDRPAAREVWQSLLAARSGSSQICMVTGERAPIARLHPSIKGVWGAQSSGAALVSFNLDAFTSYGHQQGDNAPVSEYAAFAYGAALNQFLKDDSGHRLQIGDASTVFWADSPNADDRQLAEALARQMLGAPLPVNFRKDDIAAEKLEAKLTQIRKGEQLIEIEPNLKDVGFCVLALAPNAARLVVRFFYEGSFGQLAEYYRAYVKDMAFEPWPKDRPLPTIASCVLRTAPAQRDKSKGIKFDRKQTRLSGEMLRSILTGTRFPGALLPLMLLRIRNDHLLDSVRIALIKGCLVRTMRLEGRLPKNPDGTQKEDYLVRSDPNDPNPARRLGRLFAVIERAQLAALGDEINATVKDKFLSSAAATPLQTFVPILKNAENHLRRLRNGHTDARWIIELAGKERASVATISKRVGAALGADIGRLAALFAEKGFPTQHSNEEQGFFLCGYYQERYGGKADSSGADVPEIDADLESDGEE